MLANLVDSADIRVIQRRRGAGFPLKAIERLLIFQRIWREKLQGDETTEGCVLGLVNNTHAAAAKFLPNAVVANGAADHLGKRPVGENVRFFVVARQRLSKHRLRNRAIAQVCAVCSPPKRSGVLRRGGFERNGDFSSTIIKLGLGILPRRMPVGPD